MDGHSEFKVISPVTTVSQFLSDPSILKPSLGIDDSIDVFTFDPVVNKGDGGINDYLYEKGNQLTVLTFSLQNIINNINVTTETTQDYFKSIAELKLMTTTNREGLIVFSENIDKLNIVLADLQESLSKQEELVKLNREATAQIAELNDVMASGTAKIVEEMKTNNTASIAANKASSEELKSTLISQSKLTSNSMKVSVSSLESSLQKMLQAMDQRIASNETLNGVASRQQMTNKEIQAIKVQAAEIRKLLEIQQNRITFP